MREGAQGGREGEGERVEGHWWEDGSRGRSGLPPERGARQGAIPGPQDPDMEEGRHSTATPPGVPCDVFSKCE